MILYVIATILPLFLGFFIYLGWRPETLIMYSWFDALGLLGHAISIREFLNIYSIPDWTLYWAPNGLWTLSFTLFMIWIWRSEHSNIKYMWIFLPLFIGVFIELGQRIDFIRGTFCYGDIFAHCIATALAVCISMILLNERRVLRER